MSVVGFDFGTQSCFIAVARGGGIDVIANDYSLRNTPTVVGFLENNRIMGQSAKQQQVSNTKNTVSGFKKLLGRKYDDKQVQIEKQRLPFEIIKNQDGSVGIKVLYLGHERVFSPECITATMFTKLKEITESALGKSIYDCVIAVPVFFTDTERRAVLGASQIAGLNCLKIMNETTSTALNYGIYKQDLPAPEEKPRNVVFLDIGNASTQCCVSQFHKGKLKVIAVAHDQLLGGRDFDDILRLHFCEEFKKKYKIDASSTPRAWLRLGEECEKLKKLMTGNTNRIPLNIECLMEDKDVTSGMKREDFESMSTHLLTRIEATFTKVLQMSKLKTDDIYAVEIVGGGTRVPAVKDLVKKVFNQQPSTTLNADEAVARGAALQCAILSPTFRVREFSVTDYQPYSITLSWKAANSVENMEIFNTGHAIPFSKLLTFYRTEPFSVEASYTDPTEITYPDTYIGKFTICDVTPGKQQENAKIKVKVRINIHGLFLVSSATMSEKVTVENGDDAVVDEMETEGEQSQGEKMDMEGKEGEQQPAEENNSAPATDGEVNNAGGDDNADDGVKDIEGSGDKKKESKGVSPKKAKQPAKPKIKTIDLPIQGFTNDMPPQWLQQLHEEELKMIAQDKLEREKSAAKNSLEEYVYELRSKLSEQYENFVVAKEKDNLMKMLDDTENWLYDEGENESKKVYEDRLLNLKSMTHDIITRYTEHEKRPAAFEALGKALQQGRKFVQAYKGKDEKYDHLTDEEVEKVEKCINEKQTWFEEKSNKQASLKLYENPYVLADQVYSELRTYDSICNPIINKKKPKVEPPPPDTKPEVDATNGSEIPVQTDPDQHQPGSKSEEMDID